MESGNFATSKSNPRIGIANFYTIGQNIMQIKSFKNAPKFAKLQNLAIAVQTGQSRDISFALLQLKNDPDFCGPGWQSSFNNLAYVFTSKAPV